MTDALLGFFAPWAIYTGLLGLHLVLPARRVIGYVRDEHTGELLAEAQGLVVGYWQRFHFVAQAAHGRADKQVMAPGQPRHP